MPFFPPPNPPFLAFPLLLLVPFFPAPIFRPLGAAGSSAKHGRWRWMQEESWVGRDMESKIKTYVVFVGATVSSHSNSLEGPVQALKRAPVLATGEPRELRRTAEEIVVVSHLAFP